MPSICLKTSNAGCSPAPEETALLLAQGQRFPIRIEATPEETVLIEWRPGQQTTPNENGASE